MLNEHGKILYRYLLYNMTKPQELTFRHLRVYMKDGITGMYLYDRSLKCGQYLWMYSIFCGRIILCPPTEDYMYIGNIILDDNMIDVILDYIKSARTFCILPSDKYEQTKYWSFSFMHKSLIMWYSNTWKIIYDGGNLNRNWTVDVRHLPAIKLRM